MPDIINRTVSLDQLHAHPRNYRRHPDQQLARLEASLVRFGQVRSVVAQEGPNGYLLVAGHGVVEAARRHGLMQLRVDVIPASWSDEQVEGYIIADNMGGAEDNDALLAELLQEQASAGYDLASLGTSQDELDALLASISDETEMDERQLGAGGDEFTPDLPEGETRAKPGDIWQLGKHKLLVGDSTSRADIARLFGTDRAAMIFTDPPWNVAIGQDSNPHHRQRAGLENDDLDPAAFAQFLDGAAQNMAAVLDGDIYCVLGAREWPTIHKALTDHDLHWSSTIIWVKDQFVLGRSKYHRRYEPIWYGWPNAHISSYTAGRDQDDVWEFPRPRRSDEHPTMKPVTLVEQAISNSSQRGHIVFDPFLGSGTTIIAADRLGRICYGIELDPRYADVILDRYTAETGDTPRRCGEAEA